MKKLGKLIAIFFIALIALISLLPIIISTESGTSLALKFINRNITGNITVADASLSWFGTQKFKHLALKNKNSSPILTVDEIQIDTPLLHLLWNKDNFNTLTIQNLNAKITQDENGVTDLQDALGIRKIGSLLKTPVFVEEVNGSITQGENRELTVNIQGKTRQNDVHGQFSIEILMPKEGEQKVALTSDHFPVLVLDQSLAISIPEMSGLLTALFGDNISLTLNSDSNDSQKAMKLVAKSPLIQANLNLHLSHDILSFFPGGSLEFALPIENVRRIQQIIHFEDFAINYPLKGKLSSNTLSIPLEDSNAAQISGNIELSLEPNELCYVKKKEFLLLDRLEMTFNAEKTDPFFELSFLFDGKRRKKPLHLDFKLGVPKISLFSSNLNFLINDGVKFKGNLKSQNPAIEATWNGAIKEIQSEMDLSFDSDQVTFPEIKISIPHIPFQEFFKENEVHSIIQGNMVAQNPQFDVPVIKFDEITLPWSLDIQENSLRLNLIATQTKKNPNHAIKGSIRIDEFLKNNRLDIEHAVLQLNLNIESLATDELQPFFSPYPVKRILGSSFNAEITASRDESGQIQGSLDMNSSPEAFIKKVSGKFSMQNNNRDITFQTDTTQAVGAAHFQGTFHDLFNEKGNVDFDKLSLSLLGNFKHFPVEIMGKVLTGDVKITETMEAILGSQADAEIFAELKDQQGPLKAHLKGLHGEMSLDASIRDNIMYLNAPFTATVKVTPQLEHAVLREYIPILGSVASAEKPIQLIIPIDGFRLPLKSPTIMDLEIQNGVLKLDKMQFLRGSPIGKIAAVLKTQSERFDVWFTPVYFSLKNGILTISRTDLLVSNTFPFAIWGQVDLGEQQVNLIAALSSLGLKQAFGLTQLNNNTWIQVPIRGSIHNPKIDAATLTARISALAAITKAGPPGKIIGTVIQTATDIFSFDSPPPPPTTQPFPWADQIEPYGQQTEKHDALEDIIEKPVEELKKGAKKLLKTIFKQN